MTWGTRWARIYSPLVVVLSVAAVVLVIIVAFRLGFISAPWLVDNKDLVDTSTKILGTFVLTLGAVASYFRFFKGRTLSPRLRIEAKVDVFPIDSSTTFHVLNMEVTNVGSVAIWGLEPRVEIRYHSRNQWTEQDVGDWWTPVDRPDGPARLQMLDTGESSQFVVQREVPQKVWAVSYFMRVSLSSGHSWHRVVTASNRIPEKEV